MYTMLLLKHTYAEMLLERVDAFGAPLVAQHCVEHVRVQADTATRELLANRLLVRKRFVGLLK